MIDNIDYRTMIIPAWLSFFRDNLKVTNKMLQMFLINTEISVGEWGNIPHFLLIFED